MTGQQQYLRTLARRTGFYYCINCAAEPPIRDGGLCENCSANRRDRDERTRRDQQKKARETRPFDAGA